MSIFPKRTVRGTSVTIHWNFNTAHLKAVSICPFVRIGVKDPSGAITMLLQQHILALPAIQEKPVIQAQPVLQEQSSVPAQNAADPQSQKFLYLRKSTPLLVLADYLGNPLKKTQLVDILTNLQSGRHYYFSYAIPLNAPLGKYTLISEVLSEGQIRLSRTKEDDFFLVESIEVAPIPDTTGKYRFQILNHSPEPTPVKIIRYQPGTPLFPEAIEAFEMPGHGIKELSIDTPHGFLSYNEERLLLPLSNIRSPRPIRNQNWLVLSKQNEPDTLHLLDPGTEDCFTLSPAQAMIWRNCDGIQVKESIRTTENAAQYDELLTNNLIVEISGWS